VGVDTPGRFDRLFDVNPVISWDVVPQQGDDAFVELTLFDHGSQRFSELCDGFKVPDVRDGGVLFVSSPRDRSLELFKTFPGEHRSIRAIRHSDTSISRARSW
jgi:hypothetical protein